jgi:hypothetical protein
VSRSARRIGRAGAGLAAVALGWLAGQGVAGAHGGLSMERDLCKLRVGPYSMHFTGYQPDRTLGEEFCEDIPATGRTVIVLDYLDEKLRDLPVDVRIIRDTGSEANLEEITVYHQASTVHPRGTLSIEHTFPEAGSFVGLVTVVDGEPLVSRFPFAVGSSASRSWLLYGLFGAGAAAAGAALFAFSSRHASA